MDPLFPISCPFPFAGISTTAVYTLSLHDALPISLGAAGRGASAPRGDRPVRLAAVPAGGPPSRPARPVRGGLVHRQWLRDPRGRALRPYPSQRQPGAGGRARGGLRVALSHLRSER